VQRALRGYRARKEVRAKKLSIRMFMAAMVIQSVIKMKAAKNRVAKLKREQYRHRQATRVQAAARGFLCRKKIGELLLTRERDAKAIIVQALWRGSLVRMTRHRILKELENYQHLREYSATQVQKVFRGWRGRIYFRIATMEQRRGIKKRNDAGTRIITMVRGFMARRLLARLFKERMERWLKQARSWVETWSAEEENWFYLNRETQETLWEPRREGYTNSEGMLVLESGEVIVDPRVAGMSISEEQMKKRVCSECGERVAIRSCQQCGDRFCTVCYKATHQTGTRRTHLWTPTGPKDCSECELRLAERWCVSCDEAFCDPCWRTLHAKGKRLYHPFAEVSADGHIEARMYTIDGDEVLDYDHTFPQRKWEEQNPNERAQVDYTQARQQGEGYGDGAAAGDYDQSGYDQSGYDQSGYYGDASSYEESGYYAEGGGGEEGEWTTAYDADGTLYYYNNYTGVSQYEAPY
jgi:hypothetical protein